LKEIKNISIKESLINQEKFLIGFVQAEKIYKKHKIKIILIVIALIGSVIGYKVNSNINENNLIESNKAYSILLKNPNDKKSLDILKNKNEKLYNLYQVNVAIKNNNVKKLISLKANIDDNFKNIIDYKIASIKKDTKLLESYSLKQNSSLKEFAVLQLVYKLIEEKKYQDAKDKLVNISTTSKLNQYAQILNHFLITKIGK
jgi:predicted negative regulator of RcsB-dependent stress response